jgi:hypothetical protein
VTTQHEKQDELYYIKTKWPEQTNQKTHGDSALYRFIIFQMGLVKS